MAESRVQDLEAQAGRREAAVAQLQDEVKILRSRLTAAQELGTQQQAAAAAAEARADALRAALAAEEEVKAQMAAQSEVLQVESLLMFVCVFVKAPSAKD